MTGIETQTVVAPFRVRSRIAHDNGGTSLPRPPHKVDFNGSGTRTMGQSQN